MNSSLPPEAQQSPRPALLAPIPARPGRRRYWLWALVVVLLVATACYFYLKNPVTSANETGTNGPGQPARGRTPGRGNRPLAPVVAATAHVGDMNVYLNGLGSVMPLSTVTVRSRVDGQLVRVLFKEGQMVKAGDLLAEIDPRAFQVQLTQAEGQMARDQALLVNSRVDLERYEGLFRQDSIAKQQLDTQHSLVRQYEGAIKADQGAVDSARLQITYAKVTAPVSGRIGLRLVDSGNIVHASDTGGLLVITQLQPITVLFTIPEDSIPGVVKKLTTGTKLPVDAFDRGQKNRLASGTLLTIDNQIDPTTGTVKLKAQFANLDFMLFPNQFVNTRMLIDVRHNTIIVPNAGIQRGTQGTFVYLISADNSVALRLVTIGQSQGENVEILHGLVAGDVIVTDGADKLRDGTKVEIALKDGVATRTQPHNTGTTTPGTAPDGTHRRRRADDATTAPAPAARSTP